MTKRSGMGGSENAGAKGGADCKPQSRISLSMQACKPPPAGSRALCCAKSSTHHTSHPPPPNFYRYVKMYRYDQYSKNRKPLLNSSFWQLVLLAAYREPRAAHRVLALLNTKMGDGDFLRSNLATDQIVIRFP